MGKIRKMDLTTTDKKVRKHCNICEKAVTYTTSLGFIDSIRDFIYIVPSDFDNNRCKYLCMQCSLDRGFQKVKELDINGDNICAFCGKKLKDVNGFVIVKDKENYLKYCLCRKCEDKL